MIVIKFDQLGRRLFGETEIPPVIEEPIADVPTIRITPFIGTDGANALDGYPLAEQRVRAKYGCPDLPRRVVPALREKIGDISSRAYNSIRRRFGAYYADQSDSNYEAAVDAFEPDMMSIEGRDVPMGQIDAFFSPSNDGIALDAATIYGTKKNRRIVSRYKSGISAAMKIGGRVGEILATFYREMISKYEDKMYAVKTMIHERVHRIVQQSVEKTPADYLSVPQNEGLTCAAADEAAGESTTAKDTTYHAFKLAAYRALQRIGYKSATKYIKDCDAGKTSGRRYIRNFRMAA